MAEAGTVTINVTTNYRQSLARELREAAEALDPQPDIAQMERERIARYVGAQLQGDLDGCYRQHDDCPACRALHRAINYLREACTPDDPPTWDERTEYKEHR